MCNICDQIACPSGCPNAPEPAPVYTCCMCDEGIEDGERYANLGSGPMHIDCMNGNFSAVEVYEFLGEPVRTACADDFGWEDC